MKPQRGEIFKYVQGDKSAHKRTAFDLSHGQLVTCNMGELVPICCEEVLPGSTKKVGAEIMVRFNAMLAPIYHRVDVYTHFFFVPNRLLWNKFEDFLTGGVDGTLTPAKPFFRVNQITPDTLANKEVLGVNSLADYLGVPPCYTSSGGQIVHGVNPTVKIDIAPFKAYQLVYNEFFRDQNLTDEVDIDTETEGQVPLTVLPKLLQLRRRCWEKDYFTSALPFAQRGPEVTASILGEAPVVGKLGLVPDDTIAPSSLLFGFSADPGAHVTMSTSGIFAGDLRGLKANNEVLNRITGSIDPGSSIHADLSTATAISINKLRILTKLQQYLEIKGRGGARYKEQIEMLYGCIVPDYRVQRPEYLGGGKSPVNISQVLQTANNSGENNGVGDMYGHGISVSSGHCFTKSFPEPGFIIGVMSIMPRTMYQQGLPRMFSRFDKLDYAIPIFGHLGEQEVLNKELYAASEDPEGTFGYQSRYAEYKYLPDTVHGDFRRTLAFWHLGRIFDNDPQLNTSFVECKPRTDIFAVQDESVNSHCLIDIWYNQTAVLPLPRFGTPSFF